MPDGSVERPTMRRDETSLHDDIPEQEILRLAQRLEDRLLCQESEGRALARSYLRAAYLNRTDVDAVEEVKADKP